MSNIATVRLNRSTQIPEHETPPPSSSSFSSSSASLQGSG
jgi:hypothetical protein